MIGVAGSGKTTALDTVTTVLDRSGYRVLGTSTSGQAARTLATEAHLDATTFASLLWRLDHGHETLDSRTVVIVDETGMADDANLARLALAVQHAHASLVLVGDHHQLAAVGPGGALAALIDRHPELTVTLDHNVRQHDAGERTALAELRDGSVACGDRLVRDDRPHRHPTRPSRNPRRNDRRLGRRHHQRSRQRPARVAAHRRHRPQPPRRRALGPTRPFGR